MPALSGRVVDQAGILNSAQESRLTAKLKDLEDKTSIQLVVVTLPSLRGSPIEEWGLTLGRSWGIGQKGKDNGALLIVAPNDRELRIEVGYGLEGTLTDATAGRHHPQRDRAALQERQHGGWHFGRSRRHHRGAQRNGRGVHARRAAKRLGKELSNLVAVILHCCSSSSSMIVQFIRKLARRRGNRYYRNSSGGWVYVDDDDRYSGSSSGGFGSGGGGFSGGGGGFGGGGASGRW